MKLNHLITSILALLSAITQLHAAEEPRDTLLTAGSAGSVSLTSEGSYTDITVKQLNGTQENFYFRSHSRRLKKKGVTATSITCRDIKDISVVNSDQSVAITFSTADGNEQHYTFGYGDPDNREFQSYIGEGSGNMGLTFSRTSYLQWDVITGGIMMGWTTPVDASPDPGISMGRSYEFGWRDIIGVRMRHGAHSLSLGLGFRWENFVTKDKHYFHRNDDGRITFNPFPEGAYKRRSRIQVCSLQFPLMYTLGFGRNRCCDLQVGPVLNVSTGGGIKTEYKLDGRRYTIDTDKRLARPVTVDIMCSLYYHQIGLYCRYSPMNRLKASTGLDFNVFSTGVIFGI